MSNLGSRTKNLLGKWKSHSQSVDLVIATSGGSAAAASGSNAANNAAGTRCKFMVALGTM
jgi:hypothetical protein